MWQWLASLITFGLLLPTGNSFLITPQVNYVNLAGPTSTTTPQRISDNSLGLKTATPNILIIDQKSQAVLYNKQSVVIKPIASITKLLTALTFLDHNPDWDSVITISKDDQRPGGKILFLPGDQVSVKDLFYTTLIASNNEAAVALARSTKLANFSAAMNQKAKQLGLQDSNFIEPTGLDPTNVSSPADLVKLAQAAFSQPDISAALKLANYQPIILNSDRVVIGEATDKLLDSFINNNQYQIIGAKTGFTDEAGYCLLLQVARTDGSIITLVLLDSPSQTSRWQEAKGLVDWVFTHYQW